MTNTQSQTKKNCQSMRRSPHRRRRNWKTRIQSGKNSRNIPIFMLRKQQEDILDMQTSLTKCTKASPSSVSNASTGSTKRLSWTFINAVDMRQSKSVYEAEIEKIMRTQMAMADSMKMTISYDDGTIKGCQTLAGWMRRRVSVSFCIACLIFANLYLFRTD